MKTGRCIISSKSKAARPSSLSNWELRDNNTRYRAECLRMHSIYEVSVNRPTWRSRMCIGEAIDLAHMSQILTSGLNTILQSLQSSSSTLGSYIYLFIEVFISSHLLPCIPSNNATLLVPLVRTIDISQPSKCQLKRSV